MDNGQSTKVLSFCGLADSGISPVVIVPDCLEYYRFNSGFGLIFLALLNEILFAILGVITLTSIAIMIQLHREYRNTKPKAYGTYTIINLEFGG